MRLPPIWIDSHCHLDAEEFDPDREQVVERARNGGVQMMLIPGVEVGTFERLTGVAHRFGFGYTLGIHPLYVSRADESDLGRLSEAVRSAQVDPNFVGIGEIGLDFGEGTPDAARQEHFYQAQLQLARSWSLPVVLHVRRSADRLLKYLRRIEVPGGIAHAFNGSEQQAREFIACGFRLGFGGSATFSGSLRIRRHAVEAPESAVVLETDAPDIAPQWMHGQAGPRRNEPGQLPRIAAVIAELRSVSPEQLAQINRRNVLDAFPRLAALSQPA
ncbi:MAG TPA: TatD family hydrolase [Burkholderiaceae bacterium]|nr:TatD family hydrolase [Burkholderiaceae bacterium]